MSFNTAISHPSEADSHTLSTRVSSATLYAPLIPFDYIDGAAETLDMTIAKELLDKDAHRAPQRRISFSHSTAAPERPVLEICNVAQRLEVPGQRKRRSRYDGISNTWTSSEEDGSDYEENEDRRPFVDEYNRLAKKYGIAVIVPEDFVPVDFDKVTLFAKQGSWIMRKLLRRTSIQVIKHPKPDKAQLRHKRSVSDLSMRLKSKKDPLKNKSLDELVRLCGASALYLPSEYAASTLSVPTCFRATAQYLVQHAASIRGIFRIPGSHSTVMALYNHYATEDENGDVISGTVRCPTLPDHIRCDVHDVASAFKKFLAGLPGGFLGRAWLFDSFVAIHSQLAADPEWTRTKQSKLRARLIALAIASIAPRYQRELICAVLGLLSMIGRAAETARREDEHGRPLPTSDLMGYGSLGVVFGPLLVGEMIDTHDLRSIIPHGTLNLVKKDSPKSMKGRHKKGSKAVDDGSALRECAEKIRLANKITEMLITHWRDVVKQMKNLGALRSSRECQINTKNGPKPFLRPSASESFVIRRPPQWDPERKPKRYNDRSVSPSPIPRNVLSSSSDAQRNRDPVKQNDTLSVRKQRSGPRPMTSQTLSGARPIGFLAPTLEENQPEETHKKAAADIISTQPSQNIDTYMRQVGGKSHSSQTYHTARSMRGYELDSATRKKEGEEALVLLNNESFVAQYAVSAGSQIHQCVSGLSSTVTPQNQDEDSKIARTTQSNCILEHAADNPPITPDAEKTSTTREYGGADCSSSGQPGSSRKHLPELRTPRMRIKYQTERAAQRKTPSPLPPDELNSTLFRKGLVSSRIRGIAASEPGEPPSAFRALMKTSNESSKRFSRGANIGTCSSQDLYRNIKDPLSRVSQAEDMASLATLAQVIQSQAEPVLNLKKSVRNPTVIDKELEEKPVASSTSHQEQFGDPEKSVYFKKCTSVDSIHSISSPTIGPATPHRIFTVDKLGSSVKALTAKFDNAEITDSPSSLPTISPIHRCQRHFTGEEKPVSCYTSNTTPARSPRYRSKSERSDRSLQSVRQPLSASKVLVSPLTASKPQSQGLSQDFMPDMDGAGDSCPPRFPRFRSFTQSIKEGCDATIRWRGSQTTYPQSRHVGNAGPIIQKRHSLGTVLPRPAEPPVDQYVNFARPASTIIIKSKNNGTLSFDPYDNEGFPSTPCAAGESSSTDGGLQRGNSILYSQVRCLQRQLQVKGDETNYLKRQLETKDNLNELGTLTEELRRTRRDLVSWKKRAEMAEKQLAMIPILDPKVKFQRSNTTKDSDDFGLRHDRGEGGLCEKELHRSTETVRHCKASYSGKISEYNSSDSDDVRDILRTYKEGYYKLE